MTYFEAAQQIIEMYNELAYMSAQYDESCGNYSEAVVIAVEAMLVKANREKMETLQRMAISQMNNIATPASFLGQIQEMVDDPNSALDAYLKEVSKDGPIL